MPEGGRISVIENERENSDLNEFSISWRETKLNGGSRRSVQRWHATSDGFIPLVNLVFSQVR